MSKVSGLESIKDSDMAISFLSDSSNLLQCIPGVKRVENNRFVVEAKIGPMKVELSGEVKGHKVAGGKVDNLLEVLGPGLTVTIRTTILVERNTLNWSADYEVSGPLAKALQNTIGREAEQVSREIVSCTVSRINGR